MAITNVPSPGAPIRSDWPISITDECNLRLVHKAGDTMTGNLVFGGYPATGGQQLEPGGPQRSHIDGATTGNMIMYRSGNSASVAQNYVVFWRGSPSGTPTSIGTISIASTSSVAYNTTSDRRLKQQTGDAADALELVEGLGALVYRGRWISDDGAGEEWVFVNSQDVEPFAPFAVTGAPDAVATADDVEAGRAAAPGEIIAQQLDASALVPLLLAAVSQLSARVAALEAP